MRDGDANELLAFDHVRVLNVTSGALRCLIGDKRLAAARHIEHALVSQRRCRPTLGR
jgi:hypothetical protein